MRHDTPMEKEEAILMYEKINIDFSEAFCDDFSALANTIRTDRVITELNLSIINYFRSCICNIQ